MSKLEYVDIKNAVEATKSALEQAKIQVELNKIALMAFELELAQTPKPKVSPNKTK